MRAIIGDSGPSARGESDNNRVKKWILEGARSLNKQGELKFRSALNRMMAHGPSIKSVLKSPLPEWALWDHSLRRSQVLIKIN